MKILGIIPARYGSTRFPGKPLADICGHPMLWWVYRQAKKATKLDDIVVATDDSRIADVCENGDEPLISEKIIEAVIPETIEKTGCYVGNLMTKIKSAPEVVDFTNIKVVTDNYSNAIYMSRSPIPYPKASVEYAYYKHLGVMIYNYAALQFYVQHERSKIERIEDVDYLRFIENGVKVRMTDVHAESLSVDNYKDLEYVRHIISNKISSGEIVV